jgi:ubiquitin-protein ligase
MAFREPLKRLRERLHRNQKLTRVARVTLWAVKDGDELRRVVEDVVKLIEDIEGITSVIIELDQKYTARRFEGEIAKISDEETLDRLVEVASQDSTSAILRSISDSASRRVSLCQQASRAGSILTSESSFVTAPSRRSSSLWKQDPMSNPMVKALQKANSMQPRGPPTGPDMVGDEWRKETTRNHHTNRPSNATLADPVVGLESIPQNQRILANAVARNPGIPELNFESGDVFYGHALRVIKAEDDAQSTEATPKLLVAADSGSSSLKRMFMELRYIRQAKVPFISAIPVGDRLDRILASIEGPPDTPYEGGIFWITVCLPEGDLCPRLRFQTRIYHPNIDCLGYICADFQDQWQAPLSRNQYLRSPQTQWYQKVVGPQWTLSSLLVALCGLLASPNLSDPLVQEIALLYVENYDEYCRCAKLYTTRYATGQRPTETELVYAWNKDIPDHKYGTDVALASLSKTTILSSLSTISTLDTQNALTNVTGSTSSLPPIKMKGGALIPFDRVFGSDTKFLPVDAILRQNDRSTGKRSILHKHSTDGISNFTVPITDDGLFQKIDLQFLHKHSDDLRSVSLRPSQYLDLTHLVDWLKHLATMITPNRLAGRHLAGSFSRETDWRLFLGNVCTLERILSGLCPDVWQSTRGRYWGSTAAAAELEGFIFSVFLRLNDAFFFPDEDTSLDMFLDHAMGADTSRTVVGATMVSIIQMWIEAYEPLSNQVRPSYPPFMALLRDTEALKTSRWAVTP